MAHRLSNRCSECRFAKNSTQPSPVRRNGGTRSLLGLLVLAAACAPTSKSYKPQTMLPDEGAVVGRVKVVYNGSDVTKVPAGPEGFVRETDISL